MRKFLKIGLLTLMMSAGATVMNAQGWSMKKATLMTSFSNTIDTANVLGEYPRPQMERPKWKNLNGIWQFQPANTQTEALPEGTLSSKILVPFPVESAISGVMTHYDKMWYRRIFTVPQDWRGQRVILHFGAVDYLTEVFINKQSIGTHKGGYDPFQFDITPYLSDSANQEISVRVYDPTDDGGQPRGKQTLYPGGIMYTPSSGIWQSVWIEPVTPTYISDIQIIPNIDNQNISLKVTTDGPASNVTVEVDILDNGTSVSKFSGLANNTLTIPVNNPKLWSPDSPFLYDLKIRLKQGDTPTDSLKSYFGMRKISMAQVGKYKKMMLNNEFLFQFGPLDQGFWPDGLYTAPTDLAIKNDITKTKALGWNMIRKHIKVEPYRWYYWADKLGVLVWQDMPSPNSYTGNPKEIDTTAYRVELERMVKLHWNSPSIISWVVFNEGQGQHKTPELVSMVKSLDPNRIVNQASGGGHYDVGDVLDIHSYPPPGCPTSSTQILACGEYGGIGYVVNNHIWGKAGTYVMVNTTTELFDLYNSYADMLLQYKTNSGLSAAVYTEITDVETELNGLLTYDRAMVKGSISKFYTANQKVIKQNIYLSSVVATADDAAKNWKYINTQPATDWYAPTFIDTGWKTGQGGFGTSGTPGGKIRTIWNSADIWMRQEFNLGNVNQAMLDSMVLKLHHDEDCEIYINGVLAASYTGYSTSYMAYPLSAEAKAALIPNGKNILAVHCHQTIGGQYIDAGIYLLSYEKYKYPLALNAVKSGKNTEIYPNPVQENLYIKRANPATELVGVYDLLGSERLKVKKYDTAIDTSSLQSGLYIVKTITDNQMEALTFMKD